MSSLSEKKKMTSTDLSSVFGNYMKYFEGIEYGDFITLQPEHIKEAIPELVPRIKFQNLFNKFLSEQTDNLIENAIKSAAANNSCMTAVVQVQESLSGPVHENTSMDYTACLEPTFDTYSFDASAPLVDNFHTPSSSIVFTQAQGCVKTVQDIIDIPSIKLKIIITDYMNRPQCLRDNERVVVAKALIHQLLVKDFNLVIKREEFIGLAKLIIQLFPHEKLGTYYIPAVNGEQAQGKLYSAYQNYKADLRIANLIQKRPKLSTSIIREKNTVQLAEKSEAFKIILEESEDFDQILDCWKFCYDERQHLLKELPVFEYVRKFPGFNSSKGYELLTVDADKLLVNKSSKITEIATKIILHAQGKRRPSAEIKDLLVGLNESCTNVDDTSVFRQLTAIRLLPHLMPLGKKKLNRTTVAQLFCPYFKTEAAADQYNIEFKEDYKENCLVLKPRLCFYGDFVSPKVQIYIADQKYFVDNCMTGFEILFKCFVGLNCSFPDETQHIWQFIQSEVYCIEPGNFRLSSTMLTFHNDIRSIHPNL